MLVILSLYNVAVAMSAAAVVVITAALIVMHFFAI